VLRFPPVVTPTRVSLVTKDILAVNYPKSNLYFEVLEGMAVTMKRDEALTRGLAVPFVLTCGASLECLLNDRLIADLWEIWFDDDYRPIVDGYLSMSLRGKLDAIVPLLTENRFLINRAHPTYQRLAELISQRNRITHNKSFFEDVEVEFGERAGGESKGYSLPEWYTKKIKDVTFDLVTGERPFYYFTALTHFRNAFFKAYKKEGFKGNVLIHPRES